MASVIGRRRAVAAGLIGLALTFAGGSAWADESLFGAVRGAEPLPAGATEVYLQTFVRDGKGAGSYRAVNSRLEVERGVTHRFSLSAAVKTQSLSVDGLLVDAYIPGDLSAGTRFSGVEVSAKYNFLSAAQNPLGVSLLTSFDFDTLDPHSGRDKETASLENKLLLQRYFQDGRWVWVGNLGLEATLAKRFEIANLPPGFEWPTHPEVELEWVFGTGISWRARPSWFLGAEAYYEEEYETEVGRERWSWFAGPSLHYGGRRWWATATWLGQFKGGGETFPGAPSHLHVIEKTKQEIRLKVGWNF